MEYFALEYYLRSLTIRVVLIGNVVLTVFAVKPFSLPYFVVVNCTSLLARRDRALAIIVRERATADGNYVVSRIDVHNALTHV